MSTRLVLSFALVAAMAVPALAQQKAPVTPAPKAVPAAKATAPPSPAASPAPSAPAAKVTPAVPTDYVIGAEDMLQITVWKNDTLSRAVPVRPDGKISLPLLHDIHAAGLTAMQLRDKIAGALAEFMPNPEVSVIVTDVRSYKVSVLGEVNRPGVLQLKADTSILEVLAMAGGFRDFASPSKIVVFRKDTYGNTHKLSFNYNRAVRGQEDILALRAGDVVVVP
ncbi:MAG: polysaccharide biosynthesis/export family protein [Candidatus Rokubacteria bacterium]|nr:polysaccharide biosynthesis/export family protein [Candidatus Rokubacteria bacterium]